VISICASAAPCTRETARSTCCPNASSVRKSSPKIFTARSAFTPDTVSSIRMAIGCVKLNATPGKSPTSLSSASMSSSFDLNRHCSRGLSVR
jgi:hypothetical protein